MKSYCRTNHDELLCIDNWHFILPMVGYVRNITYDNLRLEHAVMGVGISMLYAKDGEPAPPNDVSTPHIEDITYSRVQGVAGSAGAFLCLPESECRGIRLEEVNITSPIGGFECFRASGSTSGTVTPEACFD